MFLKGMVTMASPRFCACMSFLILLCCCVEPFAASAAAVLKPRKYGPIGDHGNMPAEGGAMEQVLMGSNLAQGRVLLEAIINEVNVRKETADVEEEPESQHKVGASSSFDLLQKALGLKYGQMQQAKEKAKLEAVEEEEEEEEKIGNKVVVGLNHTMTEKKNPKNQDPELTAEEKNPKNPDLELEAEEERKKNLKNPDLELKAEEEEKNLKNPDLELKGEEEKNLKKNPDLELEAEEEKKNLKNLDLELDAEEEKNLKNPDLELQAEEEEEKKLSISEAQEEPVVEDEGEEVVEGERWITVKTKADRETETRLAKEKELPKSDAQEEADKGEEEESAAAKKEAANRTELEAAANKKKMSESEAQEEAVEVEEEEESVPVMKKKKKKGTNETMSKDENELSKSDDWEVVEDIEEEAVPVMKKSGKETSLTAADKKKFAGDSEVQEAMEVQEAISVKKKMGNKTGLKASSSEEKKSSKLSDSQEVVSEEEADEEEESVLVKKKEGTKTGVKAKKTEEMLLPKSKAQEEATQESILLAEKKAVNKTELKAAADEKDLSKTEGQNLVEEEEEEEAEESIPVKKKVGKETDLKAVTEDEKLSKSEPQEAAAEEDEELESIPVKKKAGFKETDPKAMKDEEFSKPEAQEAVDEEEKEHSHDLEMEKKDVSNDGNTKAAEEDADEAEIDLLQEVQDLPANLQQTVGAVTTHLLPKIQQISGQSKESFEKIHKNLATSFLPLIGEKYAPIIATVVSYCLLMLPFGVVLFLCEKIRIILTLQKVLLFANVYLAAYFAILFTLALGLGAEPISFFYKSSTSSYITLQLLQAFGYIAYMLLQTADVLFTCSAGTVLGKLSATTQCLVATSVGLHYYVTVFHRAMARKPPHTSWKYYGLYCLSFVVCCLLSRIQRGKREYVPLGNKTTDKKK